MDDLYSRVVGDQDIIRKLLGKIPGFSGYIEKSNRRASDKLLREYIANHYEEQWKRLSSLQVDLVSNQQIDLVDDVERAAIKLRQFIDRIRTAAYGASSFFEATKVNEDELTAVYQYDTALMASVDDVVRAIDNLESSIGSDGANAAIRNVTVVAQNCVDAFNKRNEVLRGGEAQSQ
jgi:hypothetical protein